MLGDTPIISYPIALGFDPLGTKIKQGDGKTPEGEYSICEMLHEKLAAKYGARSLRLNYPNIADTKRGFESGLITEKVKTEINAAIEAFLVLRLTRTQIRIVKMAGNQEMPRNAP